MKLLQRISWLRQTIQEKLFPIVEENFDDPLTAKQKQLIMILETVEIERHVSHLNNSYRGRPVKDRRPIARAFVAKAVYNLEDTRTLIDLLYSTPTLRRICGFVKKSDIPSESTFSRSFDEFAHTNLGEAVHKAMIDTYISDNIIGHISRDSTSIEANEKPVKQEKTRKKNKRGRPKKNQVVDKKKRLHLQIHQPPQEALKDIPTHCSIGVKKNSKGYTQSWIGYKLHIDTACNGLPITTVLTSASVHDSQVAIPMMRITTERVAYLYDIMDAAYDAEPIYHVSRCLNHVPIIDKNPRKHGSIPLSPAEEVRYKERTIAEHTNGRLKEEFGGNKIKVKGYMKVKLHLMFGIIALFADQLLKLAQ